MATSIALFLKISQAEEKDFRNAFNIQAMATRIPSENHMERQLEAMNLMSLARTVFWMP
jgi:hypothetical protein